VKTEYPASGKANVSLWQTYNPDANKPIIFAVYDVIYHLGGGVGVVFMCVYVYVFACMHPLYLSCQGKNAISHMDGAATPLLPLHINPSF
jgi:hypothetical protein